jgi:hypothetical protein
MSKLVWDEVEKRYFETGLDQGVLYLADGLGVSWNGLISVEESLEEKDVTAYLDGVKLDRIEKKGEFKATLVAFTYPDEFAPYQGLENFNDSGMSLTGQKPLYFNLSYRTLVGNDTLSTDYGYQIHILYNLTASLQDHNYETYSSQPNALNFTWALTGTPSLVDGFTPTAHVIIDSRFLDETILLFIEDTLYGVDNQEAVPMLPSLDNLTSLVQHFSPKTIVPNYISGFSSFDEGYGDLTETDIDGIFQSLPRTKLVSTQNSRYYTLVE